MASTLKIKADMGEGFKTVVAASHKIIIDQPKMAGGTDEGPNPLEYFLTSLAGCICAISRIVANQKKIDLKGVSVSIEADIDKSVLLGKNLEDRAGFKEIRADVQIDAALDDEEKAAFLKEVERRCPVSDNIEFNSNVKVQIAK